MHNDTSTADDMQHTLVSSYLACFSHSRERPGLLRKDTSDVIDTYLQFSCKHLIMCRIVGHLDSMRRLRQHTKIKRCGEDLGVEVYRDDVISSFLAVG